jgi:tRNA nucleotidyltransferase/poly(A) polymerase
MTLLDPATSGHNLPTGTDLVRCYEVGGAVRDELLGQPSKDVELALV